LKTAISTYRWGWILVLQKTDEVLQMTCAIVTLVAILAILAIR